MNLSINVVAALFTSWLSDGTTWTNCEVFTDHQQIFISNNLKLWMDVIGYPPLRGAFIVLSNRCFRHHMWWLSSRTCITFLTPVLCKFSNSIYQKYMCLTLLKKKKKKKKRVFCIRNVHALHCHCRVRLIKPKFSISVWRLDILNIWWCFSSNFLLCAYMRCFIETAH